MGLDVSCNGLIAKCGSYSRVQRIRRLLLEGMKFYVEMEYPNESDAIDYILTLLGDGYEIAYEKFCFKKNKILANINGLDGFIPFIHHCDNAGFLSSQEVKKFMKTWELTKEYMDKELKDFERKFYLEYIFLESIHSGEDVTFF